MQSLMTIIKSDPKNAGAAVQLGNTYFDAERYADAIKWYEESLRLDPEESGRQHRPRRELLLHRPDRRALKQFDAVAEAQSEAHEDAAQPGHRARLRQAGSGRRAGGVEEGRGARARTAPKPRPRSVRSKASPRRATARRLQPAPRQLSAGDPRDSLPAARAPVHHGGPRVLAARRRHHRRRRAARRAGVAGQAPPVKLVRDPVCGTYVAAARGAVGHRRRHDALLLFRAVP